MITLKTPSATASVVMDTAHILLGDAFDWLEDAEPNSIHAVVTDPPYGLIEPLHHSYPKSVRPYLQTLESFLGDVRLLVQ